MKIADRGLDGFFMPTGITVAATFDEALPRHHRVSKELLQ